MGLRGLRVGAGVLLGASGGLMYAASWQRWASACSWGEAESGACLSRQDHRFDIIATHYPWEPVGAATQLAGGSLLVLALAFVLLPAALTGRRPGILSALATAVAALSLGAAGVANIRSGISGAIVAPVLDELTWPTCFLVPPALLVRLAFLSRGWTVAAAISLFVATPLVAAFSYAVGPYDSRPWWEAISGGLTVAAGLCLLGAAVLSDRSRTRTPDVTPGSPALGGGSAVPR